MDQFNVRKRKVLDFKSFDKKAELSSDAKHVKKGEAAFTKDAMPGEANPKKDPETLDKPKTEKGKHDVVKSNMSGPDNTKGGREVLSENVNEEKTVIKGELIQSTDITVEYTQNYFYITQFMKHGDTGEVYIDKDQAKQLIDVLSGFMNESQVNESYGDVMNKLESDFDAAVSQMKGSSVGEPKDMWVDLGARKGFCDENGNLNEFHVSESGEESNVLEKIPKGYKKISYDDVKNLKVGQDVSFVYYVHSAAILQIDGKIIRVNTNSDNKYKWSIRVDIGKEHASYYVKDIYTKTGKL